MQYPENIPWDDERAAAAADLFPTSDELEQELFELFELESARLLSQRERRKYEWCLSELRKHQE